MEQIIVEIVKDANIDEAQAAYIFNRVIKKLILKIPEMQKVIADVFDDIEEEKLEMDIKEMTTHLQEHLWKQKFKHWIIPKENSGKINHPGGEILF